MNLKDFESLSLEELREIANIVGIKFTIGNENITDKKDFLLVLDEADSEELTNAYKAVIHRKV